MDLCSEKKPIIQGRVYLITNLINGKKYVGQTTCKLNARWRQHKHLAKRGSRYAIHAAIRKYGHKNFLVSTLQTVAGGREQLLEAERGHISAHECVVPLGYNLTEGGEGVDFANPAVKSRHLQAVRNRSPEWQQHVIEAAQKRATDPEWREANLKKLQQLHADPCFQKVYATAMKRLHDDPVYHKAVVAGLVRFHKDLEKHAKWYEGVTEGLAKGRAVRTTKALARDAQLPPEERERRVKRREAVQRSRAKKKGLLL